MFRCHCKPVARGFMGFFPLLSTLASLSRLGFCTVGNTWFFIHGRRYSYRTTLRKYFQGWKACTLLGKASVINFHGLALPLVCGKASAMACLSVASSSSSTLFHPARFSLLLGPRPVAWLQLPHPLCWHRYLPPTPTHAPSAAF